MQFFRKAAAWWGLERLGKLGDITFKFGAVITGLIAANSVLIAAKVKLTDLHGLFGIDEHNVRTFYHDHSKVKKPPTALIGLIRQVEGSHSPENPPYGGFRVDRYRCHYEAENPGPLPTGWKTESEICSSVLRSMISTVLLKESSQSRTLAYEAVAASTYGDIGVYLTNNGLGIAKDVTVSGPKELQEVEKLRTISMRRIGYYKEFDVEGDGKRPLRLLQNALNEEDFSVTWRNEPSGLTNRITASIAVALFFIIVITVLVDIKRSSPELPAKNVKEHDNGN